jgi:hypothetical protein
MRRSRRFGRTEGLGLLLIRAGELMKGDTRIKSGYDGKRKENV